MAVRLVITRRLAHERCFSSISAPRASSCRRRCSPRLRSRLQKASLSGEMSDTSADGAPAVHDTLDPELLADFGHLLRNQLNAIVGAAGLLSATATSSDQRELASVVLTGSEQLAGLVDEVLDSPRIQSGDFELALHPFNLRASVESCISRVAGSAAAKSLNLSFHAAQD